MAATMVWQESNGPATPTVTTPGAVNWKSVDDNAGTAYTAAPIVAGTNSYEKWHNGKFTSGTFSNLLNGKYGHTAGSLGTGVTLYIQATMTVAGDRLAFPAGGPVNTATSTTYNATTAASPPSQVVWFAPTGPGTAGLATQDGSVDRYTNYLVSQLRTTVSAAPGEIAQQTMTLQYDEN